MTLVEHAKRELDLCGQTAEDPEFANSLIAAVEAFASYGHSGGSAAVGADMLGRLLRYEQLSELTTSEDEWIDRTEESGYPMWQNVRNPSVFSDGPPWALTSDIYLLVEDGSVPQSVIRV